MLHTLMIVDDEPGITNMIQPTSGSLTYNGKNKSRSNLALF